MPRLIIPDDFTSQRTLLTNIVAQHGTPGTDNPLTAFLTQQEIVLDDDIIAGNAAQTHDISRALLSKQSENYCQLRDNYFEMPWSHLTGSAQFLKSFYKGNTKELGNWGLTITGSGKINYPPAFVDRIGLFRVFVKKNESFAPGETPLQPYLTQQQINLAADAGFADQAMENHNSFTDSAQQAENETELRNKLWLSVLEHIKTIGGFLMKLYSNNPKALGAWGFVVDESTQKPKLRTTKLKLGEKITGRSVIIGSAITNTGEGDLHLYKGSSTTGTPVILNSGEQFGIAKGFITTTIVNPSMLIEGKFTWLTNG